DYLRGEGWPEPLWVNSGNGSHLWWAINLPNDEATKTLHQDCLRALAARFDDPAVTIDPTMFNASRICRVPGTWNRKGSGTTERPQRLTSVLDGPTTLTEVPRELLEALAGQAPAATARGFSRQMRPPAV